MTTPAESRLETATHAPSARSDVDETAAASGTASGETAGPGFGPPAADGEVGTLGPYRVVKELGRGGMGAVYAAIDTRLERRLAMKVVLPQFAADPNAKERFLREARAAAKITHDNVVTVYEADEREGVPYIAMQFLEGYPLDEYLKKKGNLSIPQVLRIAAEAAAGLAVAHKIGLVHRDIKPGNLWLEAPNGRVKVLDFGLAKPLDAEVELTVSGAVVGTPAYMSPEQGRGEKVDHRSDLFSLGAMMYRLCTGKLPFPGSTTMAVLTALATKEPPPVRDLNPDVPEPLAALIHQLLAKRADARPQSGTEVVKRARAIVAELATPRALPVEQLTSQPQLIQPQVVYAVMPVTAASGPNPFTDLDSLDTELVSRDSVEKAPAAPAPKAVRKKSAGRRPLIAAGFAILLAALVVVIIKNKDGSETKIEVPDNATVTVKDKGGKTLAQVGPEKKNPVPKNPPVADTDRTAAEWVIAQGGSVQLNGAKRAILAKAELPKDRFTLTLVSLLGTKTTDEGLIHLKGLDGLTQLDLDGTTVTDDGLAHLEDIKSLKQLWLHETQVTSAGLVHLQKLKRLTLLNLKKTEVTRTGIESFHAALPACKIEHDGGTIEPEK